MTHRDSITIIAILGDDMVVANALALLLEGEGYSTKIIQESPAALANGLLDGVDMLLLCPTLSNGARKTSLSVVRGNPKTAHVPVLTLSRARGETLGGEEQEGVVVVGWPSSARKLAQQIEAALASAPSGEVGKAG